jgi:hypothetical protein
LIMTPHERARQIDEEEFRRDSQAALKRALDFVERKQEEARQRASVLDQYCETDTPNVKRRSEVTPSAPSPRLPVIRRPAKPKRRQNFELDGVLMSLSEWAAHIGVPYQAFYKRFLRHGLRDAVALGSLKPRGKQAWPRNYQTPGVSPNFASVEGTGAGAVAQETPNITFSEDA